MTPAVRALEAAGIQHRVVEYHHDPDATSFGTEAVDAIGVPAEQVFKTLLARLADGEHVVAVVPVSGNLDLKALARAAGAKKAEMATPADAERITGYVVGGISPFGQRKPLRTFVDETAQIIDDIHASGGRRGLEVVVDAEAFITLLQANFAPIGT